MTYPDLEEYLKKWIKAQRETKNHSSIRRLLAEAKTKAEKENREKLKFTWGWVISFMKSQ